MCTRCNQAESSKLDQLSKWKGLKIKEINLYWKSRDGIFNWVKDRFHWVEIIFNQNNSLNKSDIFVEPDSELDGPYTLHVQSEIAINDINIWLKDVVKLPQYIPNFVSNGFVDMDSITNIEEKDLKRIGIESFMHCRHIMRHHHRYPRSINQEMIYNKKIINTKHSASSLELELKDRRYQVVLKYIYRTSKTENDENVVNLPIDIMQCIESFVGGNFYTLSVEAQGFSGQFTIVNYLAETEQK